MLFCAVDRALVSDDCPPAFAPLRSTAFHLSFIERPLYATFALIGSRASLFRHTDTIRFLIPRMAVGIRLMYYDAMEKPVRCSKCESWLRVSGEWDSTREVSHTVTCPNCGEQNEVEWPMNMEVKATR